MRAKEHETETYFSLLRYHVCSMELLAVCASGKNRVAQLSVQRMLPLATVLESILEKPSSNDDTRKIDFDTICWVKSSWIKVRRACGTKT